jgi:hypothetical protein
MMTPANDQEPCLYGLVTDQDLSAAEEEFPGITELYESRRGRDRTFLDLLAAYLDIGHCASQH